MEIDTVDRFRRALSGLDRRSQRGSPDCLPNGTRSSIDPNFPGLTTSSHNSFSMVISDSRTPMSVCSRPSRRRMSTTSRGLSASLQDVSEHRRSSSWIYYPPLSGRPAHSRSIVLKTRTGTSKGIVWLQSRSQNISLPELRSGPRNDLGAKFAIGYTRLLIGPVPDPPFTTTI